MHQFAADTARVRPLPFLLLPPLAGIVFWFVNAPDPRFALAYFWILPAALAAVATGCLLDLLPSQGRLIAAAVSAACVMIAVECLQSPLTVPPGPDQGFWPAPQIVNTVRTTRSGLALYLPSVPPDVLRQPGASESSPAAGDQCWDSPLPCTPYFDKPPYPTEFLRLRRGGDLSSGFIDDTPPDRLPR